MGDEECVVVLMGTVLGKGSFSISAQNESVIEKQVTEKSHISS
jgi:hypothetical protein